MDVAKWGCNLLQQLKSFPLRKPLTDPAASTSELQRKRYHAVLKVPTSCMGYNNILKSWHIDSYDRFYLNEEEK